MAGAREKLLTASDLATLCEVDLKTIHNWVDRGRIPHFRTPGRHLRFRAADAAEFLRTWGYSVPRELAKASSRSTLVIGTKDTQDQVVRSVGEGTVPLRLATHPYDALVFAGIEPPDVYVVDVKASAAEIDVIGMLEALHRATPEATFIAVVDHDRPAGELPSFVAKVMRGDASALGAQILPRESAAVAAPANQQSVGIEPPRAAGGGSR
jgi:excisionase family DNA binding protein